MAEPGLKKGEFMYGDVRWVQLGFLRL